MQIKVTGRHIEVTEAIQQFASQKAMKLLKYFDRIQEIDVVVDKAEANRHSVEFILKVEHTSNFIAKAVGDDLYACIDEAIDKLERQLTDHKEKLRNRKHNV